jgi:AsmA protein
MTDPRPRRRWPKILGVAAVVLLILGAVAVLALDRLLLSQARKQAATLSQQLGRPVTIGALATKLWGGVGVKVTDVAIGAGPGEDVPLVELRRAEVEAHLWRALRSRGQDIRVREAVVEGLHVNIVKLPDGTTNAQRVADALAKEEPGAEPAGPEAEEEASAPPRLQVDRAAIENARITFLDRTVPGAKELAVDDLDVEVKDLETGKPVELVLRAAVLAGRQNLELRVKAAPLPASLEPTPEEIVLKVEPIDLDPLAPFLPPDVGFLGGRFQADLTAKLGAAVPGGSGATRVLGGFRATALRFEGQEGGKALDAGLDADLEADVPGGSLRIGKLVAELGPASLVGQGRASGLRGDAPKFEGLEIVGRGLDPAVIAAYYPPLRKQLGDTVIAGPIGLSVRGSGTQAAQTADVRIDLTPVRLVVPEAMTKAAGAPATFTVRVEAAQEGGRVRFDARTDLAGVDLRPGESLAKGPGDPLSATAAGTYRKTADGAEVRVDRMDLVLLADRLTGKATVALAGTGAKATTRFEADVQGERLDLDRLLIPAPTDPAAKARAKAKADAEPPLDPADFAGLSGVATMRLGTLRMEKIDSRNVVARLRVDGDEVRFEEAKLEVFGGTVSAAGTHLALARPTAPFEVALVLENVAGEEALKLLGDHRVLGGTLDAAVKIGGAGWKTGLLAKSVTGALEGNLRGGAFYGKDLVASVAGPLAAKLPFAAGKVTDGGKTALGKEMPFAFEIADGIARLRKPLSIETGQGPISLDGGVRLDGTLEMPATFALAPELVTRLSGGRAKPSAPLPVTFRLTGPAWRPRLEALSLDAAVKAIAQQAAAGALGRAVGVEGANVEEVAAKKRAAAEAKAREEADRQRKKVEEEAKKRLKGIFGR